MSCSCTKPSPSGSSVNCRTVKQIPGTGECISDENEYEVFQTTNGFLLDMALYGAANGEEDRDVRFLIKPMGCDAVLYESKPLDVVKRVEGSNTVYYATTSTQGKLPRDGYYELVVVIDGKCCGSQLFERLTV